jgi:hypothetical protein
MRVKIAYTVELEDVEEEVSEIMSKATDALDFSYQELVRIQLDLDTKVGNIENQIHMIDVIRRKMMKADQVLEDCHLILQGYKVAKDNIKENEDEVQDG